MRDHRHLREALRGGKMQNCLLCLVVDVQLGELLGEPDQDVVAAVHAGVLHVPPPLHVLHRDVRPCLAERLHCVQRVAVDGVVHRRQLLLVLDVHRHPLLDDHADELGLH